MSDKYSFSVDKLLYSVLTKMKNNLGKQIGDKATYKLVIKILLKEHYSIPHLKKKIEELNQKLDKKEKEQSDFLKNLLMKKSEVTTVPYLTPHQYNAPPSHQPPPPPQPPHKKINIDLTKIVTPADVTASLKNESKQVFDGTIKKPSEIIAMTQPKHINSKDQSYNENEINKIKINLEEKSSVKHKPNFFARKENDVNYVV